MSISMPMPLKTASVAIATKLIATHVDSVTCLQCCKYYIAPERATCGHTLCHTCWRGRRACPACAASLNRRALRLDIPLQNRTEHVRLMVEAFEQFVGVKMDEFMMDMPLEEKKPEDESSKNVKEWLTSSDNHFSAPPYSDTQRSSQEPPQNILLSTSKIQIHNTQHSKSLSSEKVVHVPAPQDDWDNIEMVPDSEDVCGKRKASIAGPVDLEPFCIDENEYSNENPRRSSRKRENNNNGSKTLGSPSKQTDKQTSCNSSAGNEKKLDKVKQDWAQVKKMKKEFGRLNKNNKNKLNVSIEMCKKTQSCNSKQNSISPPIANADEVLIDDNTPDILAIKQKEERGKLCNKENLSNNTQNTQGNINVDQNVDSLPHVSMDVDNEMVNGKAPKNKDNTDQIPNTFTQEEKLTLKKSRLTQENRNKNIPAKQKDSVIKIPFFKKVPLQEPGKKESITSPANINIASNTQHSSVPASDDDIHITIRIGDVVTNITINKKQNDVQLKVNTDKEVQTSLVSVVAANTSTTRPETKEMEVQTSAGENMPIDSATQVLAKHAAGVFNKSVSTRKNTASADTAVAQFEITESVEKELSKIMECQDENENLCSTHKFSQPHKTRKNKTQTSVKSNKTTRNVAKPQATEIAKAENLELEEVDIFNSGSVKEQNFQLLKTTKNTQSEILVPTHKTKTQKTIDKRLRDLDEDDEIKITNKRQRTDTQNTRDDLIDDLDDNDVPPKEKNIENESANYDELMGQVFANIDADIQQSQVHRSSIVKRSTQTNNPKVTQKDTEEIEVAASQTVLKPIAEKYSENMFSTAGNLLEKGNTHVPGSEIQHQIENLLTPGMCKDLNSSPAKGSQPASEAAMLGTQGSQPASEALVLGTPLDDDSDKSVVEETPQKNRTSSVTKTSKADSVNRTVLPAKSLQLRKPSAKDEEKVTIALSKGTTLDSQDIGSIINLTDTIRTSTNERGKETASEPKAQETPLTINKFVDQIKHKSTPFARKSLNFTNNSNADDVDLTLCPTDVAAAKTTQEKEFMAEAFDNRPKESVRKALVAKYVAEPPKRPFLIAGSCLSSAELTNLKVLCCKKGWVFTDKYTPELTHLVVSVDDELKAQRSVKYMCALAAGKLIVAYEWVKQCLETNMTQNALIYEALDSTGDPGPNRSRTARVKVFQGITFYCMPPFSVLDAGTLESMLTSAGGRVVQTLAEAVATAGAPSLVLAEPENTQEDRFMYLAMQHGIVPLNYEWALNCLGSYTLLSIHDLLLCPSSILPTAVKQWRIDLLSREDDDSLT